MPETATEELVFLGVTAQIQQTAAFSHEYIQRPIPAGSPSTPVQVTPSPSPLAFRNIVDAVAAAEAPSGVINHLTGPGRVGDLMVRHPKVTKVAFTGSTPSAATSLPPAVNCCSQ